MGPSNMQLPKGACTRKMLDGPIAVHAMGSMSKQDLYKHH